MPPPCATVSIVAPREAAVARVEPVAGRPPGTSTALGAWAGVIQHARRPAIVRLWDGYRGAPRILASVPTQLPESGFQTIGQSTARTIALNALASGRLSRTLLVHGPPGAGKGAFLLDLLALLLCTAEPIESRPCNACRSCRDARTRAHPDLVVGSPESWRDRRHAGESQVAAARRWLLEAAGAPIVGERRVVLVERADQASEQIQNALLKALEEPGSRQVMILVADDPARLLPTIRSRSQSLRIGPVPESELIDWLVEEERLPLDQALVVAHLSAGLVGRAAEYVRSPERLGWRRRAQGELLALLGRGRADRFQSIPELIEDAGRLVHRADNAGEEVVGEGAAAGVAGASASGAANAAAGAAISAQRQAALRVTDAWQELARDLLLVSAGKPQLAAGAELHPELPSMAGELGAGRWAAFLEALLRVEDGIRANAAPKLALEAAMLAWPRLPEAA